MNDNLCVLSEALDVSVLFSSSILISDIVDVCFSIMWTFDIYVEFNDTNEDFQLFSNKLVI